MKVCVIDPSLFTLPYDQHLCGGLHAAGVDVTLCGRALRPEETVRPHAYPFEHRCYPRTERGQPARSRSSHAWWKAAEHVWTSTRLAASLRSRFDVLHFQWSALPLVDQWHWRRLARDRTVIFTVHDTTPFLGRPTSRWQKLGWRRLLDAAHGLIVHTEGSRRELVRLGIAAGRIAVVPHGPLEPVRGPHATRAALPATDGRRTLLVFGEIKPYKGIDVLLRAVARLPGDVAAGWRLIIAGRPRCDVTELQRLAARSRVPVEWRLDYVPEAEIAPLFEQAEVVVFPYRRVDASGALMLALPFGVPVVASQVGIFGELLEDGVTGALVPPGDEHALRDALVRLMRDDALRGAWRKNILERVARVWSWPAIARQHRDFYQQLRGSLAQPMTAAAVPDHDNAPQAALFPGR